METSELLKKVRKIEIKIKGLSQHLFSGEYHSAFKGRGMSFSEVRTYQYGDDIRNIDWNVTARTNEPHLKVFEEERELTVMILVDVSGSSFFGTQQQFKNEIITEICAVLAFSALNNNDKVGVIFFSNVIEKFVPPKKGKTHILRIIRELLEIEPLEKKTDLTNTLEYLNNVIKKRCTCFVLSDFMTNNYDAALKIVAKRHDLVGIQLTDILEERLPRVGLLRVKDAETGAVQWLDTDNEAVCNAYENFFKNNQQYFQDTFSKSGANTIRIRTNESYIHALLAFFKYKSSKNLYH